MNKLVIDHSYALGMAWDKTRFRNHGVVYQASPGGAAFNHSLSFAKGRGAPGSLVVVPPSESLRRIGAVRVKAQIYFDPQGAARRHNIVEGHLSFALFIDPDGSLVGSVLTPSHQWLAGKTAANAVPPQAWSVVEFRFDGHSRAELLVNGQSLPVLPYTAALIARPRPGPVRGIGPLGVFIGHWADLDDRYTFDGYIRRVQVYKQDDYDLLDLMDPCCKVDPKFWHEFVDMLAARGCNPAEFKELDAITAFGRDLVSSLTGGDEDAARELDQLLRQYLFATKHRGRTVPIEPAFRRLAEWIVDHQSRDQMKGVAERLPALIDSLPLNTKEMADLAERLCFGRVKDALENEVKRMTDDPEWAKRTEKFRERR